MSNIRLFFPESLSVNLSSKLNKAQSYYLTKVMRIKSGQTFSLFNQGGEWQAEIEEISKGEVIFLVKKKLRNESKEKDIWLAFSPIKLNYFNFMIQKATELGVNKFIPIISERTIVRKVNLERLEKIVTEASEQSNRLTVPKIEKTIPLKKFLIDNKKLHVIFGDLNTNNNNLDLQIIKNKPICILIGPEGDFSEKEREQILKLENLQSIKLNNNILRTETAAVSALSIVNYILNL
tara:strand:+ start:1467 stop:2174 length:708 start_codon:yes stop_codon:yes gene_type:complete